MQVQTFGDKTAIGISVFCVLHCVVTPLIVLSLPAATGWFIADEHFHQLLIYMVLPISIVALMLGCRKHASVKVISAGIVGLVVLVAAAFFVHDVVGQLGEQLLTVVGTDFVSYAHWQNYLFCRLKTD